MQYTTQQGVRGICPPGWHLPTDEEWKVLEGAVDSQYGIGDPEWDNYYYRGFDAGTNLKSISGWYYEGNGNLHMILRDRELKHEYRVREGEGGFDWMIGGFDGLWFGGFKEMIMFVATNFHR